MKQIFEVRSNPVFTPVESKTEFKLETQIEIVLIHTDGKIYLLNKKEDNIVTQSKIAESRFVINEEALQTMITDLTLHLKKLQNMKSNATKINSLVKYMQESDKGEMP